MPIYAYICQECSHRFEALIQGSTIPECPQCKARKLEKQISGFAVGGNDGGYDFGANPGSCGTCGDPRGPGACSMN